MCWSQCGEIFTGKPYDGHIAKIRGPGDRAMARKKESRELRPGRGKSHTCGWIPGTLCGCLCSSQIMH